MFVAPWHCTTSIQYWQVFQLACATAFNLTFPCGLAVSAENLHFGVRSADLTPAGRFDWVPSLWGEKSHQAKRVAVLQDEGTQPLNLSSKPKASESKSPTSPASPQVPALKLGPGSLKHSAPSSIGGPPSRLSSIGTHTSTVHCNSINTHKSQHNLLNVITYFPECISQEHFLLRGYVFLLAQTLLWDGNWCYIFRFVELNFAWRAHYQTFISLNGGGELFKQLCLEAKESKTADGKV